MSEVRVEQTTYEMPPRAGFVVAHFLTVSNIERSARFYETVFGGRILSMGNKDGAPGYIQIANTWLIVSVGGGPTPDKPSVTLSTPANPDAVSSFMNIRVADIHATYEAWRKRGADFITEPKDKYGETRCYIRDPDGYIIEVGQSTPGMLETQKGLGAVHSSAAHQHHCVDLPLVGDVDYAALCRLVTEAAWRVDNGQAQRLDELFTEDGVLTLGEDSVVRGRSEIKRWGVSLSESKTYGRIRHVCGNMRFVETGDDTAQGVTILTVFMTEHDELGTTMPWQVGEDHDRFVRTPEGWRISSRLWVPLFVRGA